MVWLKNNIRTLLILIPVSLIILILVNPLDFSSNNSVPSPLSANADAQPTIVKEEAVPAAEPSLTMTMIVDVKGAVHSPGVYEVKEGDRVTDALKLAGGETEEADMKFVNLSQKLQDEMVIYVPEAGEEVTSGPAVSPEAITGTGAGGQSQKININTADAAELQTINGIGPAKAEAILAYRETEGNFQSIEDIKNISGIGDKTFDKLKESIDVK
ncbi:helix-hairpin-helix domain-containing protein [Jeotgalibacillus proteolyticus]|uniref:helix-hairpin-helix domain-containing protein n=1 Tax=Jeotgalibacillus proteolyticus TaxID=2082395 RepID=UPI003CEEB9DB